MYLVKAQEQQVKLSYRGCFGKRRSWWELQAFLFLLLWRALACISREQSNKREALVSYALNLEVIICGFSCSFLRRGQCMFRLELVLIGGRWSRCLPSPFRKSLAYGKCIIPTRSLLCFALLEYSSFEKLHCNRKLREMKRNWHMPFKFN